MEQTLNIPSTVYFKSRTKYDDITHHGRAYTISSYVDIHCFSSLTCWKNRDSSLVASPSDLDWAMPLYIYKIELKDTHGIVSSVDKLPKELSVRLRALLELELPVNYDDIRIDDLEDKKLQDIVADMYVFFGVERTDKILSSIGVRAIYEEEWGTLTVLDDQMFRDFECSTTFNPETFKKAWQDVVEDRMLSKLEDSTCIIQSILDADHKNFHYPLLQALEHRADMRDICFNVLRERGAKEGDSRETFDQILKKYIESFSKKTALQKEFNSVAHKSSIPKTMEELEVATKEDIPKDKSLILNGVTQSAFLKVCRRSGRIFVVKASGTPKACETEYEAYKIYQAFGVKVPEVSLVKNKKEQRRYMIIEYIDGETIHTLKDKQVAGESVNELYALRQQISRDFPIDALMGNYDAGSGHHGNIIYSRTDGELYRIDPGSALQFRHNGEKKPNGSCPREWGNSINDFFYLRSSKTSFNLSACLDNYGGISNQEILERLKEAKKAMPKVKKAASPENYQIISHRLDKSLAHFEELCGLEEKYKHKNLHSTAKLKAAAHTNN